MTIQVGDWVQYKRGDCIIIEEVKKVTTHSGTGEIMMETLLMRRLYDKDILEVRSPQEGA